MEMFCKKLYMMLLGQTLCILKQEFCGVEKNQQPIIDGRNKLNVLGLFVILV